MPPVPTNSRRQPTTLQRAAVRNAVTGKVTLTATTTSTAQRNTGDAVSRKKSSGGSGKLSTSTATRPVCEPCKELLAASTELIAAYRKMFTGTKRVVLDDALHHHCGDEAWQRVLRTLGANVTLPGGLDGPR